MSQDGMNVPEVEWYIKTIKGRFFHHGQHPTIWKIPTGTYSRNLYTMQCSG